MANSLSPSKKQELTAWKAKKKKKTEASGKCSLLSRKQNGQVPQNTLNKGSIINTKLFQFSIAYPLDSTELTALTPAILKNKRDLLLGI